MCSFQDCLIFAMLILTLFSPFVVFLSRPKYCFQPRFAVRVERGIRGFNFLPWAYPELASYSNILRGHTEWAGEGNDLSGHFEGKVGSLPEASTFCISFASLGKETVASKST